MTSIKVKAGGARKNAAKRHLSGKGEKNVKLGNAVKAIKKSPQVTERASKMKKKRVLKEMRCLVREHCDSDDKSGAALLQWRMQSPASQRDIEQALEQLEKKEKLTKQRCWI
jgi:hypothetical protein